MPIFVTFYENNYNHFEKLFGKKYNLWPDAWRMAWVVRNAMSHNGNIYFKDLNTSPINWNVVTISHLDQNKDKIATGKKVLLSKYDVSEDIKSIEVYVSFFFKLKFKILVNGNIIHQD